ncbi:hypothetical protein [Cyclobacterium xiamenense]|jgi:hypothetical protein|uniref:hypothetical protein n=1 Tax=Cyclobacterium xiamenense TaxID=1297121 RepID=UPI0035CEBF03
MGLIFPSERENGALWVLWSWCFAGGSYVLAQKFTFLQTAFLSWFFGFVLMWLVIGNMQDLPYGILPYALLLSLLEVFGAVWLEKNPIVSNLSRAVRPDLIREKGGNPHSPRKMAARWEQSVTAIGYFGS